MLDISRADRTQQTGLASLVVQSAATAPPATEQTALVQLQSERSQAKVQQPDTAAEPAAALPTENSQTEVAQAVAEQQALVQLQPADREGQVQQGSINVDPPMHPQTANSQQQAKQPETELEDPLRLQTAATAGLMKQDGLQGPAAGQKSSTEKMTDPAAGPIKPELSGSAATAMALLQAGKRRSRSSKLSIDSSALISRC